MRKLMFQHFYQIISNDVTSLVEHSIASNYVALFRKTNLNVSAIVIMSKAIADKINKIMNIETKYINLSKTDAFLRSRLSNCGKNAKLIILKARSRHCYF